MKRLYFIRHGLSEANAHDVWGGQIETPLMPEGRQQAILAGQKAKAAGLLFDVIITSPLSRASETAKLFATQAGYPEERIEQEILLLERSFGILDGTPNAKSFFDNHVYKDMDNVPGAEKVEDLQRRAAKALQKISKRSEQTILIVGHGAFGRAFRRVIQGQPYTDEFDDNAWKTHYIPNAELIQLI